MEISNNGHEISNPPFKRSHLLRPRDMEIVDEEDSQDRSESEDSSSFGASNSIFNKADDETSQKDGNGADHNIVTFKSKASKSTEQGQDHIKEMTNQLMYLLLDSEKKEVGTQ